MVIIYFIARRGQTSRFFSDNTTTFNGANNELIRELKNVNEEQVHEQLNGFD